MASALVTSQAASHLPPTLQPAHLGSRPPIWQGHRHRALWDKAEPGPGGPGGTQYFQDYRNESFGRATLCQRQRDQYRDRSGRLHLLDFFEITKRPYHCPPDLFTVYKHYPETFVKYRFPSAQPLTFGRTLHIPSLPGRSLVGRYGQFSDSVWNGSGKAMFT